MSRALLGWLAWALTIGVVVAGCNRVEPSASLGERPPTSDTPIPVEAMDTDRFPGPVVDPRGALGKLGRVVLGQSKGWRRDLGIDFQVVVVDPDQGPIEQLSDTIFHLRRVGQDAPTGGILLVLDPAAEQARFSLSYELEPVFPDFVLGRMAEDQLAPYASYSALGMAVMDVFSHLRDFAYVRAAQGELDLAREFREREGYVDAQRFLAGGGGAIAALSNLPIDADLKARVGDEKRARYAPSSDPMESLEAHVRVQRELAGDPTLELFTPASRVMRTRYPFAPFEQIKRAHTTTASKPLNVLVEGDRAVILSDQPVPHFVPTLLHRIDGTWRIDLVETWKNLFFDHRGRYSESNSNHPYHFALKRLGPGPPHDIAAWDIGDADLFALLDRLEASPNPLHRFMAGELLYRNCWMFLDALTHYEAVRALAPDAPAFAHAIGDRAIHLSFHDMAAEAYGAVGDQLLVETARALRHEKKPEEAQRLLERALAENPYDTEAMVELSLLLAKADPGRSTTLKQQVSNLVADPAARHRPVGLVSDPRRPELNLGAPAQQGATTLYDHSRFGVSLVNRSGRPIVIDSVDVRPRGTAPPGSPHSVTSSFRYPRSDRRLAPGQAATLERTWGFPEDTAHEQVSYEFRYCWTGAGGDAQQCTTDRVDTYPR